MNATYFDTKGNDFQNTLHEEECREHDIQVLQDFIIRLGGPVILETQINENVDPDGCTDMTDARGGRRSSYLHHKDDCVERNESHDTVLKRRRYHELPHSVLKALLVLRHVARQRFGIYSKINTGSLEDTEQQKTEKEASDISRCMFVAVERQVKMKTVQQ